MFLSVNTHTHWQQRHYWKCPYTPWQSTYTEILAHTLKMCKYIPANTFQCFRPKRPPIFLRSWYPNIIFYPTALDAGSPPTQPSLFTLVAATLSTVGCGKVLSQHGEQILCHLLCCFFPVAGLTGAGLHLLLGDANMVTELYCIYGTLTGYGHLKCNDENDASQKNMKSRYKWG